MPWERYETPVPQGHRLQRLLSALLLVGGCCDSWRCRGRSPPCCTPSAKRARLRPGIFLHSFPGSSQHHALELRSNRAFQGTSDGLGFRGLGMHCPAGSLHPLHWGRLWAAGPASSGTPCSQHPGGMPARAGGWSRGGGGWGEIC